LSTAATAARRVAIAVTVAALAASGSLGAANAGEQCPAGIVGRACPHWLLERAEEEIAAAVERKRAEVDRRSTLVDRTTAAKTNLLAAHREWLRFREAECRAEASLETLRSAMTPEAWTVACLHRMTRRRIEELDRR
jgi:uncharacterized protein YecT (DUF1311 family)